MSPVKAFLTKAVEATFVELSVLFGGLVNETLPANDVELFPLPIYKVDVFVVAVPI